MINMHIIKGNIWDISSDYKVITTNGIVKKDERLVMGKGIALEAKKRFPDIDKVLGGFVSKFGNHVWFIGMYPHKYKIISFPTKHHWKDKSDIKLIEQSCLEMIAGLKDFMNIKVLLPPVGCGNGGLDFEKDVKPILSKYLDDRFYVVLKQ